MDREEAGGIPRLLKIGGIMEKNKRVFEISVSGFLFVVTLYLFYISVTTVNKFPNQGMSSMDFPKTFFAIQMVFCLIIFFNAVRAWLKTDKADSQASAERPRAIINTKVLVTIVLIVAYAICWNLIGYILSTFLFVVAESRMLDDSKDFWRSLLFALFVAIFTFIVFGILFQVSFPEPLRELLFG